MKPRPSPAAAAREKVQRQARDSMASWAITMAAQRAVACPACGQAAGLPCRLYRPVAHRCIQPGLCSMCRGGRRPISNAKLHSERLDALLADEQARGAVALTWWDANSNRFGEQTRSC